MPTKFTITIDEENNEIEITAEGIEGFTLIGAYSENLSSKVTDWISDFKAYLI